MTLTLFLGAWGKVIHEKKPEAKNLVIVSLYALASCFTILKSSFLHAHITARQRAASPRDGWDRGSLMCCDLILLLFINCCRFIDPCPLPAPPPPVLTPVQIEW
jgi:hypothetical protein